jgi:thioredoxin 1
VVSLKKEVKMSIHLTDENFESEVLNSDKPALVDFWADWCAPCKIMGPILEELSEEYSDKVKVAKLNVDEASNNAAKYDIKSIPTLILFDNGQEVARLTGAVAKDNLTQWIDSNLKS